MLAVVKLAPEALADLHAVPLVCGAIQALAVAAQAASLEQADCSAALQPQVLVALADLHAVPQVCAALQALAVAELESQVRVELGVLELAAQVASLALADCSAMPPVCTGLQAQVLVALAAQVRVEPPVCATARVRQED